MCASQPCSPIQLTHCLYTPPCFYASPQLLTEVEFMYNVLLTCEGRVSAECSPPHGIFLYSVRKGQPVPGSDKGEIADKVRRLPASISSVTLRMGHAGGGSLPGGWGLPQEAGMCVWRHACTSSPTRTCVPGRDPHAHRLLRDHRAAGARERD